MTEPKIGLKWGVKDGAASYVIRGFVEDQVVSQYSGTYKGYAVVSLEWFAKHAILEPIKVEVGMVLRGSGGYGPAGESYLEVVKIRDNIAYCLYFIDGPKIWTLAVSVLENVSIPRGYYTVVGQ